MVFCPSCGKANPDDAVYCNYCSKPIIRLNNSYPRAQQVPMTPLQMNQSRPHTARKVEMGLIFFIIILMGVFIFVGISEAMRETIIFANIYVDTYYTYGSGDRYRINIDIKNIDSTPKRIDSIYLNGNTYDSYSSPSTPEQYGLLKQTIQPNQHLYGQIYLPTSTYGANDWNRGDYVKVSFKTSDGKDCTTSVYLS
jgi:hypothetical protein